MMDQAKQVLYTILRVFFGSLLGFAIAAGAGIFSLNWTDWKPAVGAAFAAVLVVVFNFLNAGDKRYGVKKA